ncbi:hypothetical protein [Pseudoalteromonas sp. T1lg24]|uniref:hypothetical protein n=1 Tax=Pseudoalteromonas sp. T1lg24 TaxID=2077099 RepID=UPI000CF6529A|nr:hypothetical protein [Pseudoalteromonas sp. T1lg24]
MSKQLESAISLQVQKKQLSESRQKILEIKSSSTRLREFEHETEQRADSLLSEIELLESLLLTDLNPSLSKELTENLDKEEMTSQAPKFTRVDELEIDFIDTRYNWEEYIFSLNKYTEKHALDLKDPFQGLLSPTQESELRQRIKNELSFQPTKCDNIDYMIAVTSGILSGLVDVLFVGAPNDSVLGDKVDSFAGKATEKFAKLLGWNEEKALERGSNPTASAIGFLERKFKVNYDQATTASVGGLVKNLSLKNHHLKSLAHSPDIIGLFFSVLNQFTNTSSFISDGEIITVKSENYELEGHTFLAKLFSGIVNWFGHIMSDWAGSSGTVGQGRRGTGVPIPFYNLFLMFNVGEFGENKQTLATIATKVFEEGYDFRHGITMAIPVALNELIIRFSWSLKAYHYHKQKALDCLPIRSPELQRMLLVGHGALCMVDGIDAYIRGAGNPVALLSRLNLIGWVRFSHLTLKEINSLFNQGKIDHEKFDAYLDKEFKTIMNSFCGSS